MNHGWWVKLLSTNSGTGKGIWHSNFGVYGDNRSTFWAISILSRVDERWETEVLSKFLNRKKFNIHTKIAGQWMESNTGVTHAKRIQWNKWVALWRILGNELESDLKTPYCGLSMADELASLDFFYFNSGYYLDINESQKLMNAWAFLHHSISVFTSSAIEVMFDDPDTSNWPLIAPFGLACVCTST